MKLNLIGHEDRYAVEQLQMSLFGPDASGEATSRLHRGKYWLTAVTTICKDGKTVRGRRRMKASDETVRDRRRILQQSYYKAAVRLLSELPPWGALAGVRPTKISTRHILEGGNASSAARLLKDIYYVTDTRQKLAVACSESTVHAVRKMGENDISLYVGIPFCPTRCTYCSFVSRTVGRHAGLLQPYLDCLLQEIAVTGKLLAGSGKTVRTVYIGGGTPTTLNCNQMATLLDAISTHFDLSRCIEFTVEGGRPDTLSEEKLRVIRQHGADRMSINPQTMVDSVLHACGRPHTGDDVKKAYEWAQSAGFDAINMDLIAGLPTDDFDGFRYSLDTVAALRPANITVHTLALKKGADLFERRQELSTPEAVTRMVDYANALLPTLGYSPYYLYRQKYMSGSFENIGWSRDDLDCLYNIYMMEELHTIVSLGGGGMNKVNLPDGTLQRFHNPKFPEQYIEMIENVLEDKRRLFSLL
ncbi:MAG: coproporphyrinogen dehydrogenase HemZ [Oscillospiraceae bacterium]|nr:coproporphyrinogen dehydrogenase HemZ [Oscillospiraceae bacterium]